MTHKRKLGLTELEQRILTSVNGADPLSKQAKQIFRTVLKRYLEFYYQFEVFMEDGNCFITYPDLPGCMGHGPTIQKAVKCAEKSKRLWMEVALERGMEIPEPAANYSGRLVLRMPKSLHRDLARSAKRDGVSLNQYLISQLAKA